MCLSHPTYPPSPHGDPYRGVVDLVVGYQYLLNHVIGALNINRKPLGLLTSVEVAALVLQGSCSSRVLTSQSGPMAGRLDEANSTIEGLVPQVENLRYSTCFEDLCMPQKTDGRLLHASQAMSLGQ